MRLLVFSDLHAHAFRPFSDVLPNGRNSRLQDTLDVLEEIYHICRNHKVDGVLCGGDLFHARSVLSVATFNDVYEAIAKIKTVVKFFVLAVGNHDQSNKLGTIHSTQTFNAVIDVIDEPQWYTKSIGEGEFVHIYVIPYSDDKDKIIATIKQDVLDDKELDNLGNEPKILLGHFGVSGAEPGANFVLKSPDLLTLPDLAPNTFAQVFLGHYHMPQELLPNVRFVGAPLQHNWGDTKQQRGVWLYDTDADGEYATPTMLPIEAPCFVRCQEKLLDSMIKESKLRGNIVRVVFDNHIPRDEWATIKDRIINEGGARWAEEWLELSETTSTPVGSYTANMDLEDMIDPFVDDEADDNLDSALLKQLGHEFIRSCR